MTENGKEVTSPPSASPAKGNGNTRRRPNRGRGKTLKNTGQDAAAKDRLAVPVPPDKETSEGTVLSTLSAWNEGSKGKKHGRQTRNRNPNSNNAKQEKIPAAPKNDEATKEAEVSVVADPASNSVKEEETVSVHDSNGLESKDTQQASNDEAPISSNEQMQKQKQISLERKRIKRRNQRLRKKQQVANESSTDISPMADSAQAGVEKKSNSGPPTKSKIGMKKKKNLVKNTESLDPVSTFVRPSMRVHVASSHTNDYAKPLRHDDAIIVPEFFGKEDDLSTYEKLVEELDQLQKDQVKGVEWTSWHQGAHMIATNPNESKAFKDIVEKLCQYFHIKEESSFSRLNWYRDSKDWKPFHHDSAAFNKERAKKQNITVGVSFGACRELAFLKSKTGESTPDESCRIYFPQPNNTCFTFGRDVNINFKHGINALPDNEHDSKGRISILVWGWTDNIIEEIGSPVIVADQAMKTQSSKETKIIQRKKARIDRRKEKRKALMQKKKAEQKATPEAGNDTTISQPDTTEAVIHA